MLLISWNVAGFSKTVQRIQNSYNPPKQPNEKQKKRQNGSACVLDFFRKHDADIVCLQEHKIPLSQLSSRSEPLGCAEVEGYESFWSCCVDKNKRGLNGVVTFSKEGTVQGANALCLGSDDLDGQGRCIMTDHGGFALFNVYVPCSGGHSTSSKMTFLHALRKAMKKQREKKPIILVGDLNISHSELDVFWKDRVVLVDTILEQARSGGDKLPEWKQQLCRAWPMITAAMATKKVVPVQTTNTLTGGKFDKFRLSVSVGQKRVFIGKHESTKEHCLWCYDFEKKTYVCPETDEKHLTREANAVYVGVLTELMSKIVGVEWSIATQREIATTEGRVSPSSPPRRWLNAVLEEDGMVDPFRHFYPTAEGRFTCWNQFTNRRYENEGTRIDYTLVDACLLKHVRKGQSLRGSSTSCDSLGEEAALCAATASGAFKPVSFGGEGITEASQEALDSQFGAPHTGMIYTPPSYSDHIAVSLLIDVRPEGLRLDEKNASIRKAQPHKNQKTLSSYFAASTTTSTNTGGKPSSNNNNNNKTKSGLARKQPAKRDACSFFAPRKASETGATKNGERNKRAKLMRASTHPTTKQSKPSTILHHFGNKKSKD